MKICLSLFISISCVACGGDNPKPTPLQINKTFTKQMESIVNISTSYGLNKFPMGFWTKADLTQDAANFTEAEVKSWADAGFTIPMTPLNNNFNIPAQVSIVKKLLTWSNKYGMKLIVSENSIMGYPATVTDKYVDNFKLILNTFSTYNALFGFWVVDEPNASQFDAACQAISIQKGIAPGLHPYSNLLPYYPEGMNTVGTTSWPKYLDSFIQKSSTDLICYDYYNQLQSSDSGWDLYFKNLRLYREASLRNGVPFWTTLSSVANNTLKIREPSLNDIRWQVNTAIACGTHGIMWYFYHRGQIPVLDSDYGLSPVDSKFQKTHIYYDMQNVQVNFQNRYKDLFNNLINTKVYFTEIPYGDEITFTPDKLVLKVDAAGTPMLISEFVDKMGVNYLMVVNLSMNNNSTTLITFSKSFKVTTWDDQGIEYEGVAYSSDSADLSTDTNGNAVHTLHLLPGQEAVYKLQTK